MLSSFRILDLTWVLGGPFAGQLLAQLGADVIKVETPDGDSSRTVPIHKFDGDPSFFLSVNRGKRSIALDLKHPDGRKAFYDLVKVCDAVIYGFAPDVPARLGIDFASLKAINPKICVGQLIGLHDEGEFSRAPAYDLVVQALGGVLSITGAEGGAPARVGYQIADLAGGLYLALATCGALLRAATSGEGESVQVSLLDCQLSLLTWQAQNFFNTGSVARAMGSRNPTIAPSEAFRCKDGRYLAISPTGEHFWRTMCGVIGRPELLDDSRFGSRAARIENVDALYTALSEAFATKTADEWSALFFAARVPAAKVLNIQEAVDQPLARARRMVEDVTNPATGNSVRLLGNPFKYADQRSLPYPPTFAGATREVFRSVCGYSDEAIDRLIQNQALFAGEAHDKTQ